MAFKSGETDEVSQSLSAYFGQESTKVLESIFQSMAKDEASIREFNNILIKSGFKPK